MTSALTLGLVAAGGAAGAVSRYLIVAAAPKIAGAASIGVLSVNVVGSFAIGFLAMTLLRTPATASWAAFAAPGFLGAFTTFSAFSWEALALWEKGRLDLSILYVGANVGGALLAVAAGAAAARAAGWSSV